MIHCHPRWTHFQRLGPQGLELPHPATFTGLGSGRELLPTAVLIAPRAPPGSPGALSLVASAWGGSLLAGGEGSYTPIALWALWSRCHVDAAKVHQPARLLQAQ